MRIPGLWAAAFASALAATTGQAQDAARPPPTFRLGDVATPLEYAATLAIDPRRAFPCFDEPGWKTSWRLTIDAPSSEVVASNTPALRSGPAPGQGGWTRHEFAPTKPLPSYLVALAVGPFEVVDGGTAGQRKTKLRYLALKGRGTEARWAKEATPVLLEILEDYFGMPSPFDKLVTWSIPQSNGVGVM